MKFTLGERIRKAREELGLTQSEIASKIGMTQQGYQDIEAGDVQHPRKINELAQLLNKPREYLLFGTDYNLNNIIKPNEKIFFTTWQAVAHWDKMPTPLLLTDEKEDYVLNFGNFHSTCFALRVQGDSMTQSRGEKSFNQNDIIIVDPLKPIKHGKFVVYSDHNLENASFKQYILDGNKPFLKPLNPQYPVLELTSNIVIRGVVVAHLDANL